MYVPPQSARPWTSALVMSSLRTSRKLCAENVDNVNGPVPTGFLSVYVVGSLTVDQMCLETIGQETMLVKNCSEGTAKVKTTWLGPAAVTEANSAPMVFSAALFLSMV